MKTKKVSETLNEYNNLRGKNRVSFFAVLAAVRQYISAILLIYLFAPLRRLFYSGSRKKNPYLSEEYIRELKTHVRNQNRQYVRDHSPRRVLGRPSENHELGCK